MKTLTNKASALVLGAVFALTAVTAPAASAGELEDQIDALRAQITTLQAKISGGEETATPGAGDYTWNGTLLRYGSRGDDVAKLQTCLNKLGNNTGVVDGIFGSNTKAGVMSFQAENGLVVDGIVGPMTGPKYEAACVGTSNTGGTTTPSTDTEVEGDKLVVEAMASDDLVVGLNQKVIFTKLMLTAGDEDVMVSDIELEFKGTADRSDLDKVTVLDATKSEIDSDTFNSDDEATVDADLEVEAGETVVVYIGGVTDGTFTGIGLDMSVKVVSIDTDGADVEGLPTMGAAHEINSAASTDEYDAEITRRESSSKIGEDDVEIAEINIDNDENSNQIVKAIKLQRVGAGDSDDTLTNVSIEVDGKNFKAEIDSNDDDEYTFDFGDGIEIEDGDDMDFTVMADINDDATATVAFDIIDLTIEDEEGVLLSDKDGGDSANAGEWTYGSFLTVDATNLDLSENSEADDEKVAAGTNDVELQGFEVEVTGDDITDSTVEVTFDITVGLVAADASDLELENVAIYKDGTKISDDEDVTFTVTGAGLTESITVSFDNVEFDADEDPIDYMIMGDINVDATDGTKYVVSQIDITNPETDDDDLADVMETVSGTDQTEIEVEGAVMTMEISAPSPAEANADKDDVLVAEIELDAEDSGDDFNVTEVNVDIAIAGTGTVADITNCDLYDGDDKVSTSDEDASASMSFSVDVDVEKDTIKTLELRCDISSNVVNADVITVGGAVNSFDADADLTDVDYNNEAGTGTSVVTVEEGTLLAQVSSDDLNDAKVVKESTNNVVLGVLEVEADDADVTIDTLTATMSGITNFEGKVGLYVDGDLVEDETLAASMTFTGLNIEVENNQKVDIEFRVDAEDTAPAVAVVEALTVTDITLEEAGATGVTGASIALADVTVVEAVPVITQVDVDTDSLETDNDVVLFAVKIEADGEDVTLDGVNLDLTYSNVTLADASIEVYDNASRTGTAEFEGTLATGTPAAFTEGGMATTISNGNTYWVFLTADVNVTDDTRSIRVQLDDDAAGLVFTTPAITGDLLMEDDMKSLLKKD